MNLIIINSGQKLFLNDCLSSLINTVSSIDFDIHIIKEKKCREATLNVILKKYGEQDMLIFGDDIIFTKGWFEFLMANKEQGEIIGFSMLYPDTDIVQDTGYDLVKIDDEIVLKPENRGKNIGKIKKVGFRECDCPNGCALFLKKRVVKKISAVPLAGKNRWGEFLYVNKARKKGFKVIVLGHFLYHRGKSTKNNFDKLLSSESYLLERGIWENIVKKYIGDKQINAWFERVLSKNFKDVFLLKKKILFFGAGTVSKFVCEELKNAVDPESVDICSGLPEEKGKVFCGKKIIFYKDVDFSGYDIIIIAVLRKEKEIFNLIKDCVGGQKVYYVVQETNGNAIKLGIKIYE